MEDSIQTFKSMAPSAFRKQRVSGLECRMAPSWTISSQLLSHISEGHPVDPILGIFDSSPDLHKPQPPSHHVLSITQPWEDSVPLLLTELFQKLPSWLPCPQSTLCYWNTSDSSWPLPGPNPRPFKISSKVSPALPSDTIILQTVSNDSPLTTYLLYTTVNEVNVACSPSEIIVLPLSTC